MKTLVLLRHAKTEKAEFGMKDHDRQLMQRGIEDANSMVNILKGKIGKPDLIISSTATRAKQTAEIFAKGFDYPKDEIILEHGLYMASAEDLFQDLKSLDTKIESVILVNHNPAINELANYLAHTNTGMPTCAFMLMKVNVDDWKNLNPNNVLESWFQVPERTID